MWVTPKQTDRALHVLGSNYSQDFIQFYEFLKILNVCTGRNFTQIAQHLINSNEFLKLDFYDYDVDYHNSKDSEYEFTSKSDMLSNISINHKFNFYRYDSFKNNVPKIFPIEDFLSEISQDSYLSEFRKRDLEVPLPDYYSYFWKVEDILKVDHIIMLGLDADTFTICKEVVINGFSIILDYYEENKKLKEQLTSFNNNNSKQINFSHPQKKDIDEPFTQSAHINNSDMYDWQNMSKYTYPPELHLAIEVWERYYQADKANETNLFNAARFNKISTDLHLQEGNLKKRIRTILTPLLSKTKSEDLIQNFKDINTIHIDKLD